MVTDDPKSREWKRWVAEQLLRPAAPLEGPLCVAIVFYLLRPKTVKREWPWVKPDLENYSKAVCDAMNGIVYRDDSQIVELHLRKEYADAKEGPGVEIVAFTVPELDQLGPFFFRPQLPPHPKGLSWPIRPQAKTAR